MAPLLDPGNFPGKTPDLARAFPSAARPGTGLFQELEDVDPVAALRQIARDPMNVLTGTEIICPRCYNAWCRCRGRDKGKRPDPVISRASLETALGLELEQLDPALSDALGELFLPGGDISGFPLSEDALAAINQPGAFDDFPVLASVLEARILRPETAESGQDDEDTIRHLIVKPGQTSFGERIMNLIREGNPCKATDLLVLAGGCAGEASEYLLDIAQKACDLMTDMGYGQEASFLDDCLFGSGSGRSAKAPELAPALVMAA